MSWPAHGLERECALRLRRHVADGGEESLHSAYELGRSALAADVGVLELGAALFRAACRFLPGFSRERSSPVPASVTFPVMRIDCGKEGSAKQTRIGAKKYRKTGFSMDNK